jgi:hypothetical protein
MAQVRLSVELCTIYRYFLPLVWLVFALAGFAGRTTRRYLSPVAQLERSDAELRTNPENRPRWPPAGRALLPTGPRISAFKNVPGGRPCWIFLLSDTFISAACHPA